MASSIVTFFFGLQINTQLYHWTTRSFSRHKASDELYQRIILLSDQFMEAYMGRYGRPRVDRASTVPLVPMDDQNIVDYYKLAIAQLEQGFGGLIKSTDTDLLNIRDELVADLNKTLYLFTLQ
jgi:DNA-binding ferritin-like protein